VDVPAERPVTSPPGVTVATSELLLLQTPGPESLNEYDAPTHKSETPNTAGGAAFTVTTASAVQPAVVIYVSVAVPGVRPVTMPLDKPTVATGPGAMLHVPPPEPSDNELVPPDEHSAKEPPMGGTAALILTAVVVAVVTQPSELAAESVYIPAEDGPAVNDVLSVVALNEDGPLQE
jgi:hypothetical protein